MARELAEHERDPDFLGREGRPGNYALGEGAHLDGVLAADPFFLAAILDVTGPIRVPGAGSVGADTVVDVTTNRAYSSFDGPTARKEVLGAAATEALTRFLAMDGHGLARLKALGTSVADGHLRVYCSLPDVERALGTLGVDGALAPSPGDLLSVSVNNVSGSKVDYYADRSIDYDVQLGGDGEAISTATVTIANHAPTADTALRDRSVRRRRRRGRSDPDHVRVLPPAVRAADGDPGRRRRVAISGIRERHPVARRLPHHPRGHRRRPVAHLARDRRVGNSSGGRYDLTFFGQSTVRPTDLRVTIHAPAGTNIVWTSEAMAVDGGTATWEGDPTSRTMLSVRFRAPMPLRYLRDVTRPILGG